VAAESEAENDAMHTLRPLEDGCELGVQAPWCDVQVHRHELERDILRALLGEQFLSHHVARHDQCCHVTTIQDRCP